MSRVSMKELLEAGAHFGHLTRRWNPKMKQYIYGERNGIHIVDLHQTLTGIEAACDRIHEMVLNGGSVLFVGTKKQAQEATAEAARRCGMFHITHRWLGGMLTNFQTIKESIYRLKTLEEMERSGAMDLRPKKEASQLREQMAKLKRVLGGIEDMPDMPAALFVIDMKEERIGVHEAKILGIKVVAVVDTNCDPDDADYVIPGNDDAIRAIKLVTDTVANTVIDAILERENQIADGAIRANAVDNVRKLRHDLDERLTNFQPGMGGDDAMDDEPADDDDVEADGAVEAVDVADDDEVVAVADDALDQLPVVMAADDGDDEGDDEEE